MSTICQSSAATIAGLVQKGEYSARAVTEAFFARADRLDPSLHAFLELQREAAFAAASRVDDQRARGEPLGPLAGVPIAVKDNLVRRGLVASAGSRLLETYRSPFTATALRRLEDAGAVLIGRTNMDEFGMGSSTENSAFGPTHNPWRLDHVPGGSSGGSAAAIAADLCALAIGSDTGGSVRQPAAMCGVTGLKPTYGRISRSGLIAYASSLDCVGAFARDAADLQLFLDATTGVDPADATTVPKPTNDATARTDLRGLRIGVPWELNGPGLDDDVANATTSALEVLRELGAEIVELSLPSTAHAVPTYYLVATAEAASNLARYDGVRYGARRTGTQRCEAMMAATRSAGFGAEVQLRILLGTFALSIGYQDEYYGQAIRARELLKNDFATAFTKCDVLFHPTSPVAAFPIGSRIDDPLAMYLCDALTVPASLAGLPALSQPCGFTTDRLPIGMQWTAPAMHDELLLRIAAIYQRHTDHHLQRPAP